MSANMARACTGRRAPTLSAALLLAAAVAVLSSLQAVFVGAWRQGSTSRAVGLYALNVKVGSTVEAKDGDGKWYAAKISKVNEDGTFQVQRVDAASDSETADVTEADIKEYQPPTPSAQRQPGSGIRQQGGPRRKAKSLSKDDMRMQSVTDKQRAIELISNKLVQLKRFAKGKRGKQNEAPRWAIEPQSSRRDPPHVVIFNGGISKIVSRSQRSLFRPAGKFQTMHGLHKDLNPMARFMRER